MLMTSKELDRDRRDGFELAKRALPADLRKRLALEWGIEDTPTTTQEKHVAAQEQDAAARLEAAGLIEPEEAPTQEAEQEEEVPF